MTAPVAPLVELKGVGRHYDIGERKVIALDGVTLTIEPGVLGRALGLLVGLLAVSWIISSLFADTWPEIGMVRPVSTGSAAVAVMVGVVAATATHYLLSRRLTRMDLPSTLRVVE
jgi:putative ABC transport system permease protein